MNQLIFILIFLYIVNGDRIKSFFEGFVKERAKTQDIKDKKILDFIKEKAGLKLDKIMLVETGTTWAMMAGLPSMPYMIVSKDAYENFSKDEMEWLFLHEAGHYILWHNLKIAGLQLLFIVTGVVLIANFNHIFLALLLGFLLPILDTQIARKFEYEANDFALKRMNNPKGLENIYERAKQRWRSKGKVKDTLMHKLFKIWTLDIYKNLQAKAVS